MRAAITFAVGNVLASVCLLVMVAPSSARMPGDEMGSRLGTKRLAAGAEGNHTCFVRADGNVLCWGDNTNGQIGDGTSGNVRRQPTATGITNAVGVAVGKDHSCALLATGSVPVNLPFIPFNGKTIVSSGGGFRTCAIKRPPAAGSM